MVNLPAQTMSCGSYIRQYTGEAIALVVLIGILACFATLSIESWWLRRNPIEIHINSVTISPSGDWIVVDAETEPPGACIRHTQHMLSSDIAGEEPVFLPIGSGLNGATMSGTAAQFKMILPVPRGVGGVWQYVLRTSYTCPPFGLVSGIFVTPPKPIDLGPMRGGGLR